MRIWIYPGSFDPVTNGHMDIIERASALCDELRVVVMVNRAKKTAFTPEERVDFLTRATEVLGKRITVDSCCGLTLDYAKNWQASAMVRGLRSTLDYDFEQQIAAMNRKLAHGLETVFLMAQGESISISSSLVKEYAYYGADISGFVPQAIHGDLLRRLSAKEEQ